MYLMAGDRSQHRLGIALVVAAAVAWSTAPFVTRLLPFDSWTILFWRGLFGGGPIATLLVLMHGWGDFAPIPADNRENRAASTDGGTICNIAQQGRSGAKFAGQ